MTHHELEPSDYVYSGIKSLRGWDIMLDRAHGRGVSGARPVGVLLSGVLLAGGEERMPVAIAGELDKDGAGTLAILHADSIVTATTRRLGSGDATSRVDVHSLDEVTRLEVTSRHNYYDGTKNQARHTDLAVTITVNGTDYTFRDRGHDRTPLTSSDAVLAALQTIRTGLGK